MELSSSGMEARVRCVSDAARADRSMHTAQVACHRECWLWPMVAPGGGDPLFLRDQSRDLMTSPPSL
eukprot:4225755-Prymnesium_polylepis.1